jgi:hypothetical protein
MRDMQIEFRNEWTISGHRRRRCLKADGMVANMVLDDLGDQPVEAIPASLRRRQYGGPAASHAVEGAFGCAGGGYWQTSAAAAGLIIVRTCLCGR